MAVLLPGKFLYLGLPHTATCATMRALYHGIPGCYVSGVNEVGKVPPEHLLCAGHNGSTHHLPKEEIERRRPELFQGGEISVSTVRHPYDLVATWWVRQETSFRRHSGVDDLTFAKFVELVDDSIAAPYIKNGRMFWMRAEHYLRYESLQADLDRFLEGLGLPSVQLERVNVSKKKRDWKSYYTEEIRETVRRRFGEDAKRFGYEL